MAHGFGGTRDSGLLAFAEGFAEAGIDAFVFDYPRRAADKGGRLTHLREYPVDHFDVYEGHWQQRALADQLGFLSHVLARPVAAGTVRNASRKLVAAALNRPDWHR